MTNAGNGRGSVSDGVRAVLGGGSAPGIVDTIEYITIDPRSDAAEFGELTLARRQPGSLSDGSRGVYGGGQAPTGVEANIDYLNIGTLGSATAFGLLQQSSQSRSGSSDGVRGLFNGGYKLAVLNDIDYITIQTTSYGIDFGDMTSSRSGAGACSGD